MRRLTRREFLTTTAALGSMLAMPMGVARGGPEWIDRRQVGPFVCVADFSLAGYEPMLAELPALEAELRRVLNVGPCRETVTLYLLSSRQAHQQLLKERFPEVPYRRALYVKQGGESSVFVYRHDELAVDIRHECTHALLHADLPMVPLWLDEGLAEYFEVAAADRARRNPNQRRLKWSIRLGTFTDMKKLEAKQRLDDLSGADYEQAWAWTHFMLHGPEEVHAELVAYLHDIRQRQVPGQLSDRITQVVGDPSVAITRHFQTWTSRTAARVEKIR